MTKFFGLALCACRLQALACRPSNERLFGKKRALEGSQSCNWSGSLRRVEGRGNRQTVAYLVVLWRELMNGCGGCGGCCSSVAELPIINFVKGSDRGL